VLSSVEFAYDVFNRRVAKRVDADGPGGNAPASTFFSWENDQILLEFAGDEPDDLSHRYLYGPLVDQVLADEQLAPLPATGRQAEDWAGSVLWPLADHLGTLRDLAAYDPQGTPGQETSLASHRTFDSFGNLVDETNPAVEFLFAFTARDRDPETGLQYHRARYYDPTLGRWLSEDPIGFAGDPWNLYRYVANSSTNLTDPTGKFWIWSKEEWRLAPGMAPRLVLTEYVASAAGIQLGDGIPKVSTNPGTVGGGVATHLAGTRIETYIVWYEYRTCPLIGAPTPWKRIAVPVARRTTIPINLTTNTSRDVIIYASATVQFPLMSLPRGGGIDITLLEWHELAPGEQDIANRIVERHRQDFPTTPFVPPSRHPGW